MINYNKFKDSKFNKLSEREIQVAIMIFEGKSTLEIAKVINVKPNTISTFKKKIFLKVAVCNEIELLKYAIKNSIYRLL